MGKTTADNIPHSPKLITARQVQQEYLNIDLRRLRNLLNTNCHYRKIGRQYFYIREEVEHQLLNTDNNVEYQLKKNNHTYRMIERRQK